MTWTPFPRTWARRGAAAAEDARLSATGYMARLRPGPRSVLDPIITPRPRVAPDAITERTFLRLGSDRTAVQLARLAGYRPRPIYGAADEAGMYALRGSTIGNGLTPMTYRTVHVIALPAPE